MQIADLITFSFLALFLIRSCHLTATLRLLLKLQVPRSLLIDKLSKQLMQLSSFGLCILIELLTKRTNQQQIARFTKQFHAQIASVNRCFRMLLDVLK